MHFIPRNKMRNVHSKINLSQCTQLQSLITLCNVLLRMRSQDIHCLRTYYFIYIFFRYNYIYIKEVCVLT